jgi:hypothetical protein
MRLERRFGTTDTILEMRGSRGWEPKHCPLLFIKESPIDELLQSVATVDEAREPGRVGRTVVDRPSPVRRNREGKAEMPEPTDALPGSLEKLQILEDRARRGQYLWHPLDARFDGSHLIGRQAQQKCVSNVA